MQYRNQTEFPRSYIMDVPRIEDAQYEAVFGTIGDGSGSSYDWRPHKPMVEKQGNTSDCVAFSRENISEIVAIRDGVKDGDGQEFNFSELDLAVGSGTGPRGNSLRAVADYAYRTGVSLQKDCEYDPDMLSNPMGTWAKRRQKYDAAKNKPKIKLGNYSWVAPRNALLKDALEHSPLQIAIGVGDLYNFADVVPRERNPRFNHAITLLHIDANDIKYIFDHYDKSEKKLAADYEIMFALSFRELPKDWKVANSSAEALLKRLHGKYILRAEAQGQIYWVDAETRTIKYMEVSGKMPLFTQFLRDLSAKGFLIGVNETNFALLQPYVE